MGRAVICWLCDKPYRKARFAPEKDCRRKNIPPTCKACWKERYAKKDAAL